MPTRGRQKKEFENIELFWCILNKYPFVFTAIVLEDGNSNKGKRSFILGKKSGKNFMRTFAPALGIIFGSALGILAGLSTGNELVISAGTGAGTGLVAGEAASAFYYNKAKS